MLIWHVLTEICAAMCFRICPYLFNSVLTSVNLLKNDLGDGLEALSAAFEKSSTLKSLCGLSADQDTADFNRQGLNAADARLIAVELQFNSALKVLDLGFNNIRAEGAKALAAVLSSR